MGEVFFGRSQVPRCPHLNAVAWSVIDKCRSVGRPWFVVIFGIIVLPATGFQGNPESSSTGIMPPLIRPGSRPRGWLYSVPFHHCRFRQCPFSFVDRMTAQVYLRHRNKNAGEFRVLSDVLHNRRANRLLRLVALALVALYAAGCVQRRMTIRTNPPGALVYIDNYEIGTTPVSTDFIYYGKRQIRIEKPGYETLTVEQPIPAPWFQWFP